MRFLIADKMHHSLMPMLEEIGLEYDYKPEISKKELKEGLSEYEGLVIRSKAHLNEDLLQHADRLKIICRAGAGIDNLDVNYIESRGIKILNAPEGNRNALAEHCVGLLFALLNNIVKGDKEIRKKVWDREGNRGHEISNKSIGIIGYGYMGSAFADKLKSFGCEILVYDKYKTGFGDHQITESSLEQIFSNADILSLHVPLTEETKGMVDEKFLRNFNKPIWLLNTSRGEVLTLSALREAMISKNIYGAALDVLENEKINTFTPQENEVFEYLINSEKVILTPHVGGWTFESYERINKVLVEKLKSQLEIQ